MWRKNRKTAMARDGDDRNSGNEILVPENPIGPAGDIRLLRTATDLLQKFLAQGRLWAQLSGLQLFFQLRVRYHLRTGILDARVMFDKGMLALAQDASLVVAFGPRNKQNNYNILRIDGRVRNNRPQMIIKIGYKECVAGFHAITSLRANERRTPRRRHRR